MSRSWNALSLRVLAGEPLGRADALNILSAPDDELLALVDAAFSVRQVFFGRDVNLHVLCNAKSGACGEDCAFCSQSAVATSDIARYPMKSVEEIVAGAREAHRIGAVKYCTVISGRSPSVRDMETICEALRRIKTEMKIHLCVSVGLLSDRLAAELKEAGADRINHNLETSKRFFPRICTTHRYEDRVETVVRAKAAGLEICCGGLVGMGETEEDRVDLALALRELGVHSIPVNFLDPRAGTPLAGLSRLSPRDCLRTLVMFRMTNPATDIRAAGGREANLGALQVLALYVANSIFTQGYLTTPGQGYPEDLAMIEAAGFRVGRIEA